MRVLALDDEQVRHDEFARRYVGHDLVAARTVCEALVALKGPRFDFATLDHDLGSGDGTGRDVADFIASMPPAQRPGTVEVHSWNPAGARAMVRTLRLVGVRSHIRLFSVGDEP